MNENLKPLSNCSTRIDGEWLYCVRCEKATTDPNHVCKPEDVPLATRVAELQAQLAAANERAERALGKITPCPNCDGAYPVHSCCRISGHSLDCGCTACLLLRERDAIRETARKLAEPLRLLHGVFHNLSYNADIADAFDPTGGCKICALLANSEVAPLLEARDA